MDLRLETENILSEFNRSWSFDLSDLNKPSGDEVLRRLIAKRENPYQQRRLELEFFGTGPLEELLTRSTVKEIVINGPSDIWYEQNGEFARLQDSFLSEISFKNFIERLCVEAAIKVDLIQPFTDGKWRDFRVHLTCAPLTPHSYHLVLRRQQPGHWTLDRLIEAQWCSNDQAARLRGLIEAKENLLFIGPTGCGKTTVLGACLKELPENERVVIMEDTDELDCPNRASTKLLTRSVSGSTLPEITLSDLVRQSLRMRPFRLVMGEVRGAEAKDLLMALATGHSGSFGTLHASEARQALLRMEMLIQLGAPQWQVSAIRQLIQLSLNVLVVCGMAEGRRRLEGLFRIAALESFGFLLEPIV